MPRQMTVVTPENIPITMELAGMGSRFGALLIDLIIQLCGGLVVLILFSILAAIGVRFEGIGQTTGGVWGSVALGVVLILGFLLVFGYYIIFELLWNGQTPGKRVFNLRVVRDGGYPVDFGSVAARNLMRIADFLPVSYAAGALTLFFHEHYKRLGDLVAGTVVIKEQQGNYLPIFTGKNNADDPQQLANLPPDTQNPLDVLTPEEIELLRRFASRRWQMTSDDSERLAYRLLAPMVERLNITFLPGTAPRYADLVSALVVEADKREEELNARGR